jgi:hypothetical protein
VTSTSGEGTTDGERGKRRDGWEGGAERGTGAGQRGRRVPLLRRTRPSGQLFLPGVTPHKSSVINPHLFLQKIAGALLYSDPLYGNGIDKMKFI